MFVAVCLWSTTSMGETGFFWCEYIVTSPKNVKTLHEQIIVDISGFLTYEPADIRSYPQLYVVYEHFPGFAHAWSTILMKSEIS